MREEPIPVPAPPGWLVVEGVPAPGLVTAGLEGILLLDTDEPAASALAGALGLPVVAPGGPVVVSPGGTLFAADGWWLHVPGGPRVSAGHRWPSPGWQELIPGTTPWPLTARPIPAGWLLSTAPSGHDLPDSVAVDPDRPRLVFDATVGGNALAAALRALPPEVRAIVDVVPFVPGQGAGRATASFAAAELSEPVTLVNGLPLHTPYGTIVVHALDAGLRPVWPEPAGVLRCLPDGHEEVVASSPPQAGLRAVAPATYALDLGWLVRVSGGGLHALPSGPLPPARGRASLPADTTVPSAPPVVAPPAAGPIESTLDLTPYKQVADARYRVVVGTPGLDINDLVWPVMSALFTAALTDVPAAVELEVIGSPTPWGRTAAGELAERHPGAGDAVAEKPYARAEVLPLGGSTSQLPAVAADGPGRRRRLLLAGAATLAVLAIGTGAVAAWPGGPGPVGSGGLAGERYTGPGLDPGATNLAPSAGGSRSAASARPSRSGARASGSAAASSADPATAGGLGIQPSGTPSQPLGLEGTVNLAAGRGTRDSGHAEAYGSGNITDGDAGSYWESRNNAFPQWVQVDLGAPAQLKRAVLRLPPSTAWPARSQRIEVQGSTDDKTFSTLAGAASYTFDAASGQRVTVTLPGSQWRYIRLVFTANSVQPAGQLSGLELYRG